MQSPSGMRSMEDFKDILLDRSSSSDFVFMTKPWEPLTTRTPDQRLEPSMIKHQVFVSNRVQAVLDEVSRETGKSKPMLCIEIHQMLDEMGYNRRMPVIRWVGFALIKVLKKTCAGLLVNERNLDRVKSVMGGSPVVFAPSHRSYADFILLTYVCYHYDIEIPVVAAGVDFEEMYVVGRILRNCCAFYMKRSFGSDKLYWAVFGEYVSMLLTNNDAPVEFFIEGTRSRSGKSLAPKLGFLSMVLEPFFCGDVEDVTIIPISISYDRALEEDLFAYELLGAPKPKESTSRLLKALNVLNGNYGRIYIDFAEPISVRQFCSTSEHGLRSQSCVESITDRSGHEMKVVPGLAYAIVREQQQHAVLTAFNLIAVILNNSLFTRPQKLGFGALVSEVIWLRNSMVSFGALTDFHEDADVSVEDAVRTAFAVHENLVSLSRTGFVSLASMHTGTEDIEYVLAPGHSLLNETMKIAVPVMTLQQYVNPCFTFLFVPAIITVIVHSTKAVIPSVNKGELYDQYHYIRMLFIHEFVMGKANEIEDFESCLDVMDRLRLLDVSRHRVRYGSNIPLQSLLMGLLRPYFFSYLTMCITLQESSCPRTGIDLVREAQKQVESVIITCRYPIHPYSLSVDVFQRALRGLELMQAVERISIDGEWLFQKAPELMNVIFILDKFLPGVIDILVGNHSNGSDNGGKNNNSKL